MRALEPLGLLSELDRAALAVYCEAWGRWVEAEEALRKFGVIIKGPGGLPTPNPYLRVANHAMDQLRGLLAEFGLSPSSRTRLRAPEEPLSPEERELLEMLG